LKVSVDTNVFIDVKNKGPTQEFSKKILDWVDSGALQCVVSAVLVAEMCAGYHAAGELSDKDDFLTHVVSSQNYEIMELSTGLADEAGRVRAATGLRLPDAIIVSSALKGGAECLISNDLSLKKAMGSIRVVTAKEFVEERSGGG
jgi:uncharacterized protein